MWESITLFKRESKQFILKYFDSKEEKKPVLVFLRPIAANNHQVRLLLKLLSKDFRVISPSHPGFDRSTKLLKHDLDWYHIIFDEFVSELGIQNYFLAGFSFGAYQAVNYYAEYKRKSVKSLLLFSPLVKHTESKSFKYTLKFLQDDFKNLGKVLRRKSFLNLSLDIRNANLEYEQTQSHIKMVMGLGDLYPSLAAVDIPTLIIFGGKDRIVDYKDLKKHVSKNKMLKLHELMGQGHNSFALKQNSLLKVIEKFLKENVRKKIN